ncbi:MAG: glycosyltransferase family 39 protein [Deltaproteobacteria bacterium]|nr:glycosyltransferase family 39 protein [Deltaproteobacteria bacterium]
MDRALWRPVPAGWTDPLLAVLLGAIYTALLLGTVGDLGYARDEGFYFDAARSYQRWFELLGRSWRLAVERADAVWSVNHEHPAFVKSLFALSHLTLFDRHRVFAMEGTSYRFPAMALSGLAVAVVYLWGSRARGRMAGAVGAVSLAAMPRFFFHAHLACFDAPVVAMWTLCAYAYWRSMQRGGYLWPLGVGIAFGLALNTKHNSWFLPVVCGLHALLLQLPGVAREVAGRAARRRALAALGAMATIGPLLFYATWPWIWRDTVARLAAYARFHLHHVYYNMEFLGQNYFEPPMPRAYAFVMTAATVPAITLLLFAIGLGVQAPALARWWAAVRRQHERAARAPSVDEPAGPATALFWLLALGVQYGAWLSPSTPIFGGTKHWMTAYPFMALLAGAGFCAVLRRVLALLPERWTRGAGGPAAQLACAACVLVGPAVQAGHAHPWGLSAYTPLVGGAAGGATLGLNRGFWGYTTGMVAGYLNRAARRGAPVYPQPAVRRPALGAALAA